jgi:repressor of nif and glnA expression
MKERVIKSAINSTINGSIKQSILDVLSKAEKPLSTQEIASKLERSWHTIIRYCLDLQTEDKISKFSLGRISAWSIKNER